MSYETSKTLIMRVKEADSEMAWIEFSKVYSPFIYSIIRKCSISHEDTEELTQTTLVKIWKALEQFLYHPERCKFRVWVARISKNTALDFIKSKRNRNNKMNTDDGEVAIMHMATDPRLDELAEREWKIFLTKEAWEHIQSSFKPLKLKIYSEFLKGMTAKEVAESNSIHENTAMKYRKVVQDAMATTVKRLSQELDG